MQGHLSLSTNLLIFAGNKFFGLDCTDIKDFFAFIIYSFSSSNLVFDRLSCYLCTFEHTLNIGISRHSCCIVTLERRGLGISLGHSVLHTPNGRTNDPLNGTDLR